MTDLAEVLDRIALDLAGRSFALVGGLAVSVRTEPRFTRDVDLAVEVASDQDAEAIVASLTDRGWRVTTTLDQEAVGRLAAVRIELPDGPGEGRVVDLLFASSGIEPEVVQQAEELEVLPGIRAPVASIGHLIVLKALARADDRPQDAADLVALARRATAADLGAAREAARLVVQRGYHRGRDLVDELEQLVAGSD